MSRNKILITGFSGFVARHFIQFLYENNVEADICGIDIECPQFDYLHYTGNIRIQFHLVNLLDNYSLGAVIKDFKPQKILHLASYSSVAYSWRNPVESFVNNTNIFLNLISSVGDVNRDCRILSVGSSEEYGNVKEADLPLLETHPLNPVSPYAVARVSQELLSKVYSDGYKMNIILTRSFNHIGPYQSERFVVPGFIRRVLNIYERGEKEGTIETGDISIVRDFVDVRDVVRAYWLLLCKGTPGQTYNICSGIGMPLQEIINLVSNILELDVKTKVNVDYVRPSDNRMMIGSYDKIFKELGWEPEIPLRKTILDMVNEMRTH